jgi:hypothetical protein
MMFLRQFANDDLVGGGISSLCEHGITLDRRCAAERMNSRAVA